MSPRTEPRSFIQRVLEGREDWSVIDEWVEEWHNSDADQPLHEFLGMTLEECNLWAADARNIVVILFARRHAVPLGDGLTRVHEVGLAARTQREFDSNALSDFLRDEGIIP